MGEQQEDRNAWLKERMGKFTSSNLDCLLVKGKSESTLGTGAPKDSYPLGLGAITLCHEKLAERLCDEPTEFSSPYTDWGTEQEPFARKMFEEVTGMKVEEVGFIPAPDATDFPFALDKDDSQEVILHEISGGSPDGVIYNSVPQTYAGDDKPTNTVKESVKAIIEIKCPATSQVHLKTLLSKCVNDKKYMIQMQWNMYCTGANLAYFVSYDPRMTLPEHKMVIVEVERDEEMITQLKERILVAEKYLQELKTKLL